MATPRAPFTCSSGHARSPLKPPWLSPAAVVETDASAKPRKKWCVCDNGEMSRHLTLSIRLPAGGGNALPFPSEAHDPLRRTAPLNTMPKRKTNNAKTALAQDLPGQAVFDFTNSHSAPAEATKPAAMPTPPGRNAPPATPVRDLPPAKSETAPLVPPPRGRRAGGNTTAPDAKRSAQCARMAKSRRKDAAKGVLRTEVKLPEELRSRIEAQVARSGLTLSEVITSALAEQFPASSKAPAR